MCIANGIDDLWGVYFMLKKARAFAIKHHADQLYGEHPYSIHLDAVAKIAQEFGDTAAIIAYLHDVVEDTSVDIELVEAEFGPFVATCVAILTDEPGKDRQQRKPKTYAKMALVSGEPELALIVKAADRLVNMRTCISNNNQRLLSIYQSEYRVFELSVYRQGLCDEIWTELATIYGALKNESDLVSPKPAK